MRRLLSPRRKATPQNAHLDHPLGTIRVQRKAIRHLYLRLDPADGSLRVNAPRRLADGDIRAFVSSRRNWIERQRRQLAERPPLIRDAALPDAMHLLGESRPVILLPLDPNGRAGGRIDAANDEIRIHGRDHSHARDLLRAHCRRRLKALLEERVPQWAAHMDLPCPETRIKRMTSRWGTCNIAARRIWLNLELVRLPVAAIDLVIVHELAHLIERGHNRRFYAVMDQAYPDWRRWEATLSAYGIVGL